MTFPPQLDFNHQHHAGLLRQQERRKANVNVFLGIVLLAVTMMASGSLWILYAASAPSFQLEQSDQIDSSDTALPSSPFN